jgi:hypothetical protein
MTAASVMESPGLTTGQPRQTDAVTLLSCYTFLLVIIPSPLVFAPLGAAGSPATIFAALLLCAYLVTWLHSSLPSARQPQPVRRAAIAWGCAIMATYVSVNRHALPSLELNGADRGLILISGWLGVLLLAADGIDSMERLETLIRRVVMGGTAMAALGVTQFMTGLNFASYVAIPGLISQHPFTDLATRDSLYRPSATAQTAIELAAVLAVCLPLAIYQARFAPRKVRLRRWLQVAVIGAVLPMTVSRTAIVALVTISLVLLPSWPKRERRLAYLVGSVATVVLWASIPGLIGTFQGLFLKIGSDTSTTSRTGAFKAAGPFISQHPWLGHGFDTFFPQTYFFTDDQYLLLLIETGVIGLLAMVALFVTGWRTARSARRTSSDPRMRYLAQCFAAAVAASAVSFATFDAFSFSIISGLTFLVLGCAAAVWRLARTENQPVNGNADLLPSGARAP